MPKRFDDLYHSVFKQQKWNKLKLSVEGNHKILIEHLSKEARKTVLRIIDVLAMMGNYQSEAKSEPNPPQTDLSEPSEKEEATHNHRNGCKAD